MKSAYGHVEENYLTLSQLVCYKVAQYERWYKNKQKQKKIKPLW